MHDAAAGPESACRSALLCEPHHLDTVTLTEDGYNTPRTVDEEGNLHILKAAAGARHKHLVLLSSTGVQECSGVPRCRFLSSMRAALSAKAAAEAAIQADAAERCRIQLCLNRGSNRGIRTTHTTATLTTPERIDSWIDLRV